MANFTIETCYHVPVYRHRTYQAQSLDQACRLAIEDDDWSDEKVDTDSAGETFVSGIWRGRYAAYRGRAVNVPSGFQQKIRRQADHFEVLLGVLKILAHLDDRANTDAPHWLPRARAAIAKAEAILAGDPDPA